MCHLAGLRRLPAALDRATLAAALAALYRDGPPVNGVYTLCTKLGLMILGYSAVSPYSGVDSWV
jgi:hypothetical protein